MPAPDRKPLPPLARHAIGFVLGAALAYLVGGWMVRMRDLFGWADYLALLLAAVLIFGGGMLVLATGSSALFARLGPVAPGEEQGEPADPAMLGMLRTQAWTNVLAGVAMAAPPLAVALAGPDLTLPLYGVLMLVVAIQMVLNVRVWREGDELIRATVVQSAAITAFALQFLLFLYAAAERMDLVEPVTTWPIMVLLMALYLIVGTVVMTRRGLARG